MHCLAPVNSWRHFDTVFTNSPSVIDLDVSTPMAENHFGEKICRRFRLNRFCLNPLGVVVKSQQVPCTCTFCCFQQTTQVNTYLTPPNQSWILMKLCKYWGHSIFEPPVPMPMIMCVRACLYNFMYNIIICTCIYIYIYIYINRIYILYVCVLFNKTK